jgi:hypothetical protein
METQNSKVYETKDYGIFKIIEGNRSIKEGQVERLIESIKDRNLLNVNPIIVNTKMEIIDGQSRLAAAKQLNVPIHYMVAQVANLEDVRLLNINVKTWGMDDYLESYLSQKLSDYYTLKKFHDSYAIPLTICLVLLSGMKDRAEVRASFKNGEFKVTSLPSAKRVAEKLLDIREYADRGVWRSRDFIQAVIGLDNNHTINHEKLLKKFKQSGHTIYRQGSTQDYLRRFTEIYDYKPKAE